MTDAAREAPPLLVETTLRVKTYDIDFIGHVNNAVYVRWLEDLRLQLLDEYLPLDILSKQNLVPVIVSTNIHYRKGIVLDDKNVLARMWATSFDRATFHLAAEFLVRGEAFCTATQRGTFINTTTMRPVRIPQSLRDEFERTSGTG